MSTPDTSARKILQELRVNDVISISCSQDLVYQNFERLIIPIYKWYQQRKTIGIQQKFNIKIEAWESYNETLYTYEQDLVLILRGRSQDGKPIIIPSYIKNIGISEFAHQFNGEVAGFQSSESYTKCKFYNIMFIEHLKNGKIVKNIAACEIVENYYSQIFKEIEHNLSQRKSSGKLILQNCDDMAQFVNMVKIIKLHTDILGITQTSLNTLNILDKLVKDLTVKVNNISFESKPLFTKRIHNASEIISDFTQLKTMYTQILSLIHS